MKKRDELYLGVFSEGDRLLLKKNLPIFLKIVAVLIAFFVLLVAIRSEAREGDRGDGHNKHHAGYYQNWTIPGTQTTCCSNMDCRRAPAEWVPNVSGQEGYWVARVDGVWKRVPKERILNVPSPDNRAHVCANRSGDILCFRPPVAQAQLPNYRALPTLALSLDPKLESPTTRGFLFEI